MPHMLAEAWWNEHSGIITLIGTCVGVVAIVITFIVYLIQRDKKTLDWRILANEPILNAGAQRMTHSIKIVIDDGLEVQRPRFVRVRLENTGRREIRPDDFDGPAFIVVPGAYTIRSVALVALRDGIRTPPELQNHGRNCSVSPALFNRGDWVDVQLLLDQVAVGDSDVNEIFVNSVIAGQTRKGKRLDLPATRMKPWMPALGVGIAQLIAVLLAAFVFD